MCHWYSLTHRHCKKWKMLCYVDMNCVSLPYWEGQDYATPLLKSNQIKSLLLSHHHSTSALVSEILMSVLQTVQKNNRQFTYGQTVQKNNRQFTYGQTVQKNNKQFTYGQTVQKNNKQFTYGQTVQKNNKQFTYGQTVQKNNRQFTYGQTVQKNCTGAFTVLQTVQKKQQQFTYGQTVQKTTAIYIWTDSAKNNSNLHMDRQCKKTTNNLHMDSTYLQTVQKTMCKIHIHILSTLSVL